jgi:hypothetical protein
VADGRQRLQCGPAARVEGGEVRDHMSQGKEARGVELTKEGGRRRRRLQIRRRRWLSSCQR